MSLLLSGDSASPGSKAFLHTIYEVEKDNVFRLVIISPFTRRRNCCQKNASGQVSMSGSEQLLSEATITFGTLAYGEG
jgi:hypothetical protein